MTQLEAVVVSLDFCMAVATARGVVYLAWSALSNHSEQPEGKAVVAESAFAASEAAAAVVQ